MQKKKRALSSSMMMWRISFLLFLLVEKCDNVKVKVGHIGAIGAMKNSDKILELSRNQLIAEGVINENFDIEIINQMGCGEAFEGVAVGADMYHVQGVRAFLGPYCNTELDAVAKMATFWNIPIIGYMASSNAFSDKSIYKTLARISIRTTNSLSEATAALVKHYGWTKVAIVTNTGATAFERVSSFEEVFHARGVTVVKKIMFEEFTNAKSIMSSGLLEELSKNARIVICAFSSTREMTKEFMQAVTLSGLNNADYVWILPWLQTETKDAAPWFGDDGEYQQNVKDHFANTVIIDDFNGFDNTLVTPFREKIEANGLSIDDLEMKNIYGYIHLYDALRLYALSVLAVMNETNNEDAYLDGKSVWNAMRRMSFPGLATSGNVLMDDIAERAPIYAAFFVPSNSDTVRKVSELEPHLLSNCDGLKKKNGCFDLTVTDVSTGFWLSVDGRLPSDEPACGYRNERCDYTTIIVGGSLILLIVIVILCAFFICRFCENRALANMSWRIYRDDFRVINEDEVKSMLSIGSSRTKLSNMSMFVKHHAVIGTNTHASFHLYPQRRPITFSREDLQLLTQMKQAIHDNLNPFLGLSFNEKEEMVVLWKFCSRGTLQDMIYNPSVTLDAKFHGAFIRDVTLGLEYLHSSVIGYHGSLTPWACLIDRNWMIKLTDYGIANPLERWEKMGLISTESLKENDEKSGSAQKTSILYQPPEMLKSREANRTRRNDQNWVRQSQARRQMGDIYSFGMVMHEILFRSLPFPNGTNIGEVIDYIRDGTKTFRPTIHDRSQIHPDIVALLLDCWNEKPEVRPSIRRVRLNTENYLKVKGSLVDQMMRIMEQYANNLEKLVIERTSMLEEANVKADKLLSQLLPKYVANELKMGRSVPPKTFDMATVMFSDIVGFTTICSSSTPLEVVSMLNNIYSKFDDAINRHSAYKVETIGDAYMIVSGIPEENGNEHISCICDTAIDLMLLLKTYEIPHRRNVRLRIRLGIHTGTVAAGVVGLTAPRYCLFGDTVNVASRMESTSEPERIQMSDAARDFCVCFYPEYRIVLRGVVETKGKEPMTTYWLEGKRNDSQIDSQSFADLGI